MKKIIIAGAMLALCSVSAQALDLPGCKVTDYNNNVYYLNCYEVGPALSKLRELNPNANISIASSSPPGPFSSGTTGYYVVLNPSGQK